MFDAIKIRLVSISIGLTTLILSVILNAASWLIINAIILLSIFLFISIPYYFYLIKSIGNRYNFYIVLNYLLYLLFLLTIKKDIFFITLIFLITSSFLNHHYIKGNVDSVPIDDFYSPVHFAIKNYRYMNFLINFFLIIFLFLNYYLFTPLFAS